MCAEVMAELSSLTDAKTREHNVRSGIGDNQFGVKMGDIRTVAKRLKTNPELAEELWATGNFDAMMLAILLMKPKQFTVADLDRLVSDVPYSQVADWLGTNVIKQHPQKEEVRERWMDSPHAFTARMGWSLTAERIVKDPEGLDLTGLLDRIEAEMPGAPKVAQWTMNYCLAEIGIKYPEHRDRAMAMGEKIGAFRDYPTPKGCTSPFAPLWIAAMVARNG